MSCSLRTDPEIYSYFKRKHLSYFDKAKCSYGSCKWIKVFVNKRQLYLEKYKYLHKYTIHYKIKSSILIQNRLFVCPGMFQDTMIDTKQNQTLFHPTNTTENKWIRSVMFGIIGLAAVSFLLTMIYLYTHKQWKRQITTMTL